jgi:uncharacterized delta-60 repeat protein
MRLPTYVRHVLAIVTGLCTAGAIAQNGTIDPSFNPDDIGFGHGDGAAGGYNQSVKAIAVRPDGRILLGGDLYTFNGRSGSVVQLLADGRVDTSFTNSCSNFSVVNSIALQPDGKVIVGGDFMTVNGEDSRRLARLELDGSLDTTFHVGTGANGQVFDLALQPDGKVLVAGGFTSYDGHAINKIARLNDDGSLDTTFASGAPMSGAIWSVELQLDGKPLVGGNFFTYDGVSRPRLARVHSDGSLDTTFQTGTGPDDAVQTIAVQDDGMILIGGLFDNYDGTPRGHLARVDPTGALDMSFANGPGALGTAVYALAVQPDDKVLVAGDIYGYAATACNGLVRVNSNGALDGSFLNGTGINAYSAGLSLALEPDGQILFGGNYLSYNDTARGRIARVNPDGFLDLGFLRGSGANEEVSSITMLPDGRMLLGGKLTYYNDRSRHYWMRVQPDGALDTTFAEGPNGVIRGALLLPNGGSMPYGTFTKWNDVDQGFIARLDSNGVRDPSFQVASFGTGTIHSAVLQTDGKIIVGGNFPLIGADLHIARLLPDGGPDPTFVASMPGNGYVYSVALQPDGKVIIAGSFQQVNGVALNNIARLNGDGTLDASFDSGTGTVGPIWDMALQADGKILLVGGFNTYNGTSFGGIVRLNTDGTVDPGFNTGTGFNLTAFKVLLQADGKILVGGGFSTYDDSPVGIALVRLHPDGALDTTLDTGEGAFPNIVTAIAIQPDERLMIGGGFRAFQGAGRNRVARLFNDISTAASPSTKAITHEVAYLGGSRYLVPIQGAERWDVQLFDAAGRATRLGMPSMCNADGVFIDLKGLPPGTYVARLSSEGSHAAVRLIAP